MAYDVEKVLSVIKQLQEIGESKQQITARLLNVGIEQASIDDAFSRLNPSKTLVQPEPVPSEEAKLAALISKKTVNPTLPPMPSQTVRPDAYLDEEVPSLQDFSDSAPQSREEALKPLPRSQADSGVMTELMDLKASQEVIEDLLKKLLESQKSILLELRKK